jgi:hypothetical protein
MNKGQKVLAGLLAVVAVELLPVTVVATQVVMGEVEVTYEVNEDELEELENELSEAAAVAERDMNEEGE